MDEADRPEQLDPTELEQTARAMAKAITAEMDGKDWRFGGICIVAEVLSPGEKDDQVELSLRTRYKGTPTYAVGLLEVAKGNLANDASDV